MYNLKVSSKKVAHGETNESSSYFNNDEMENLMLFNIGVLKFKVSKPFLDEVSSRESSSNEVSLRQYTEFKFNSHLLWLDTLNLRWHKDECTIFGIDDLNSQISSKQSTSSRGQLDKRLSSRDQFLLGEEQFS